MSCGPPTLLSVAMEGCDRLAAMFQGTYERWTVAGSVRRGCPRVSDIEHVVIPRFESDMLIDMSPGGGNNMVWQRAELLRNQGTIAKAVYSDGKNRWGEKYRGITFEGVRHELFMADRDNVGAILAIRTGPAAFSERLVTILKQGGRYRQADGYVRRVRDGGMVDFSVGGLVPVPDEATYFKLCGVPHLAPAQRDAYMDSLAGVRR